jgi:type IV secretory pathway protease TraF
MTLNGKVIPASAIYYRDRIGRELMHLPFGQHVVGPDSLFVFSSHHPRSFDSRYFGPVPRGRIISSMRPLWTLD